jgi:hypothetical protein
VISFGERKDPFVFKVEKTLLTPQMADERSQSHIDQFKDLRKSGDKTKLVVDIYPVGYQFRRTISATVVETKVKPQTHCPLHCPVHYFPLFTLWVIAGALRHRHSRATEPDRKRALRVSFSHFPILYTIALFSVLLIPSGILFAMTWSLRLPGPRLRPSTPPRRLSRRSCRTTACLDPPTRRSSTLGCSPRSSRPSCPIGCPKSLKLPLQAPSGGVGRKPQP